MIGALIFANVVQAIAFAFSRPANKSYITEIVDKEDIVTYNSHLELALQVISVSAPVLSFYRDAVCKSARDSSAGCS